MAESSRKDEVMQQLTCGIAELVTSDRWRGYLAFQSKFHNYSFGNALLILCQRPGATRCAGFHTWPKLGRNVRKGEKGIWILAPMTRRVRDDEHDADERRIVTAFKPMPVFDVSQTDGEPLPEPCCKLLDGEDVHGVYARLVGVANSIGYTVVGAEFTDSRNGDCTYSERRIRIRRENAPAQRTKTLAHELAHAMLHENADNRALAELEAESVAFIVMDNAGIKSDDYSFGYIATWARGGDEAIAAIRASGARIQQTADRIIGDLDTKSEDSTTA